MKPSVKTLLICLILLLTLSHNAVAVVIEHPENESLVKSSLYEVSIGNQSIWTESYVSNLDFDKLPDWFNAPYVRKPQEQHIASFTGTGNLATEIKVNMPVTNVRILPANRNIVPVISNNTIRFNWQGPGQLVIECDALPPLYLFANPEEENIPSPSSPDVIYFKPGVHHPGYIGLTGNQIVYIAAGAVVYGGIRAKNVSNILVTGRGILDGNYEYSQMVQIENSNNIKFEGITIRNGQGWTNTLINCRDVAYDNVKILGFGPSSDGINPAGSQRVRITNCFLRCTDDCIAIKAPDYNNPVKDVYVANNIMIGFAYADGITIGFETNAESISNVMVSDCDILLARGGSRVDGHSGFSIICDGPAVISNILFENIRVEQSELKLFELHITDGTLYDDDPPGHIRNVTVRNVEWHHDGPIVLKGLDENHMIRNVIFENCVVNGKPLKDRQTELFSINQFTDNIIVQ